jgi:hydrogenase large subunit
MGMEINRVEGDMEIQVEVEGGVVTDAWCSGTMFRGYEQILTGRDPADALVITPRICGICSTSHLYSATSALETAYSTPIAPNGTRIRNLCLMAESVMSDARHTFLMFAPDLCNEAYAGHPLYEQVVELFAAPFRGRIARETVEHSKRILQVVICFGGQWPHSTYMMPGGVTCPLDATRLRDCLSAVELYQAWYERSILGCASERWLELRTVEDFEEWLEEDASHRDSAVGVFARFGRSVGLVTTGAGSPHLLSMGCYYDPEAWQPPFHDRRCLQPAGFYDGDSQRIEAFDADKISEDVSHAWYSDPGRPLHPWNSRTVPARTAGGPQYSYAKATRYDDRVVQLGPLSDLVVGRDPLITSLFDAHGPNTWLRQFARFHRPVQVLASMCQTLNELDAHRDEPTYEPAEAKSDGDGYGLINAARGSLGHWVKIRDGTIENYQVITPTTWNGSPRDASGRRGHWEESFIGLELKDLENPVELYHIVRSHDACLVCTVHFLRAEKATTLHL